MITVMLISARFAYVVFLLVAAVLCRWLPHPPNFNPVLAVALFGGAAFSNRAIAFALPLAIMLISDWILGWHGLIPVIYGLLLLTVWLGRWVGQNRTVGRVTAGAVGASLLFFFGSNLAVWVAGGLYPLNASGLIACFVAAIPFFPSTLVSTLLFSAVLFGSLALGERRVSALRPAAALG